MSAFGYKALVQWFDMRCAVVLSCLAVSFASLFFVVGTVV